MRDPITAKCYICGHEWTLKLASSLLKSGCPNCSKIKKGLNRRIKHEDFIEKLKEVNPNITALGTYTKAKDKILFKCNICNHEWEATPDSILRGTGCPKCAVKNQHNKQRLSQEEFIKRVNGVNPNIVVLDKYINNRTLMKCLCKKHNINFVASSKTLMNGVYGCPLCKQENTSILLQKNNSDFLLELKRKNITLEPLEEYKGANTKIKFKCLKCGYTREATPSNILTHGEGCPGCINHITCLSDFINKANDVHNFKYDYSKSIYAGRHNKIIITCPIHGDFEQEAGVHLGGSGCPKCKTSKGELKISQILDDLNILYIPLFKILNKEYFPNHKFIEVDFLFVYKNQKYFIEYNGKQHYVPIKYFGGKIKFEHQCDRDSRLRKYCLNNSIKLIEIPYTEKLDNIENIIKTFINYDEG